MTESSRFLKRAGAPALLIVAIGAATAVHSQVEADMLGLELVAEGFTSPLLLVTPPGDDRRFVIDQIGTIYVLGGDGAPAGEPFLDLSERIVELRGQFDERGLLGLAFHPHYGDDGRFFVYYSAPLRDGAVVGFDHTSVVAEYRVSVQDPNRADPGSERIVLEIDQPQFNHNGGALAFGPDGYLYVALGDGGGANDTGAFHPPLGHGQDVTTLLGAILRIDVDEGTDERPYGVPDDNPFVAEEVVLGQEHEWAGDEARQEIYAWGFRNPYRFSFDRETGELWIADVGQDLWEEVNRTTEPGNFGWNIMEGAHWFDPDNPRAIIEEGPTTGPLGEALVLPVIEYGNAREIEGGRGIAVVGGHVYRGSDIPELEGHYVFADWSRGFGATGGALFVARQGEGAAWEIIVDQTLEHFVLALGEDADGELYMTTTDNVGPVGTTGRVWRIVAAN